MKRVFVISRQSLFSQGLKTLLDAEPDLEVVGWETDPAEAVAHITTTRPDAILHIVEDPAAQPTLTSEQLTRLGISAKIVQLSLDNSTAYIYQGQQLTVSAIDDLVGLI